MKSKPGRGAGLSPPVESLVAEERAPLPLAEDVRQRLLARAHEAAQQPLGPSQPLRPPRPTLGRALVTTAAAVAVVAGVVAAFQLLEGPKPHSTPAPVNSAGPPAPVIPPAVVLELPTASSASSTPSGSGAPSMVPAPPSPTAPVLDELSLLRQARRADARGDYEAVLALVVDHARNYANGRLSEEREVLRVKALVGLGRQEQARRAAARFRQRFPRSVLRHKVDEMVPSP